MLAEICESIPGLSVFPMFSQSLMPVVKADAYGHGHIPVARALMNEGASAFASGCVAEAAQLRLGLTPEGAGAVAHSTRPTIVSLLGLISDADTSCAVDHDIIPVLHSFEQLPLLGAAGGRPLSVAIKCDSGMARLGFGPEDISRLVRELGRFPNVSPVLVLSHLACADSGEGAAEVEKQAQAFVPMLSALRAVWPGLAVSLCNSAGTLLSEQVRSISGPHICRPGLGIYGGNPFFGTSLEALGTEFLPAMEVSSPVIAVRTLPAGAGIGYGHSYTASSDTRVAIIAAGYSDGFSRGLSNRGKVFIGGIRAPIIGRVSMQMTAVDITAAPYVTVGDTAWLLGGPQPSPAAPHSQAPLTADELARDWGTISYEVLCLLGGNKRLYLGE